MNERLRFWLTACAVAVGLAATAFLLFGGDDPAGPPETAVPTAAERMDGPEPAVPRVAPAVAGATAPQARPEARPAAAPVVRGMAAGWAVYEDGSPAPGAEVTARWLGRPGEPRWAGAAPEVHSATANEEGYFVLGRLRDGSYNLRATDGVLTGTARFFVQFGGKADTAVVLRPAGGTISGRVIDGSGAPVADAMVTPLRDTEAPGPSAEAAVAAAGLLALATMTDAEGQFAIAGLPEMPLVLFAEAEGRPTGRSEVVRPGAEGVEIVLDGGGTLAGWTVDAASGAAVDGIRLLAVAADFPMSAIEATSDGEGAFRFENLRAASYGVFLADPYYTLAAERMTFAVDGAGVTEATIPVTAAGGITGRVINGMRNTPVAGVVVQAVRKETGVPGEMRRFASEPSDANGVFRINGLADGRYDLFARPVGDLFMAKPAFVHVAAGQAVDAVVVTMSEGMRIRGRVLTAEGEPAERAFVIVSSLRNRHARAETDESGFFELRGMAPYDMAKVHAERGAYRTEPQTPVFGASGIAELTFTLPAAPDAAAVETALAAAMAVEGAFGAMGSGSGAPEGPEGPYTIRGQVVEPSGWFVHWAIVEAAGRTAMTNAEGRFELTGLPEGLHRVSARHRTLGRGEAEALAGSDDVRIELVRTGVFGRVVDGETGAPVTRFRLFLDTGRGQWVMPDHQLETLMTLHSDPEGRFTLTADTALRGEVRVAARAEGYGFTRVSGPAGEELEVRLVRGRRVSGTAIDYLGSPVAGAYIFEGAAPPAETRMPVYRSVTDETGTFALDDVHPSTTVISATRPGYADGTGTLRGSGAVENLTILLGTGASLEVRVATGDWPRDSVGAYLMGADGSASNLDGALDGDGRRRFEAVPLGPLTVRIEAFVSGDGPRAVKWTLEVPYEVRHDRPNSVEVDFPPLSAALEGSAPASGNGGTSAEITVRYEATEWGSGWFRAPVEPGGTYRFDGLPPGEAQVSANGLREPKPVALVSGSVARADFP